MKKFAILIVLISTVLSGCTVTPVSEEGPSEIPLVPEGVEPVAEEPVEEPISLGFTDLSAAGAKELFDTNPDLIIIDVSPHYDKGHLPGAINYYLGDGSLDNAIPNLDLGATYLVYCHVDSVAINGAQKLVDAGFTNVYRLDGNYAAWVDAGYPIEK